jgi:hypothetical protein
MPAILNRALCLSLAVITLGFSAVLPAQPVAAQMPPPPTYSAPQFRFDCQQAPGPDRDRCINYLGGILDLQRHIKRSGFDGALFCPPLFLSADLARVAYLEWTERNPYLVVGPPIISIVQAYQQAYQC